MQHFVDWEPGERMHAHIGKCITCDSSEGDTIVHVRVVNPRGRISVKPGGVGNKLCPQCKPKCDAAMHRRIDRLNGDLWTELTGRGCPCCQWGLTWHPSEQTH
jgi:hypothetical protein